MKKILRNIEFEKDLKKQLEKIIIGFNQKFKEIEEHDGPMTELTDVNAVSEGKFYFTVTVGTLISFFTLQETKENILEIIEYTFPMN